MTEKSKKTRAQFQEEIYNDLVSFYQEKEKNCPVSKKDVAFIIDSFLENIKNSVLEGKIIELRSFGTFYSKLRKGKENAWNMYRSEHCITEDHLVPLFKAGTDFKKLLSGEKKK